MATARVERRLSAILAADVVGYRRLMERDEAGTFERLKRKRDVVALDQALTAGFQFHGSSSAMRLAG